VNTRSLATAAIVCGLIAAAGGLSFTALTLSGVAEGPVVFMLLPVAILASFGVMGFLSLYVYYDGRRRGMKSGLWALLIFLFAGLPGFLVYLLMREPKKRACPTCGTTIRDEFVVCPSCQTRVGRGCPGCHRRVEESWTVCPYCQTDLAFGAGIASERA
jgi:hypothetical protein